MSRSRRRRPFAPFTSCDSEAALKRIINRKFRRVTRMRLAQGAECNTDLPLIDEVLDFDWWRGKEYFGYIDRDDPYRERAMRK